MANEAIGALTAETSIATGKLFPVGTTTTGDRATAMPIEKLGLAYSATSVTTANLTLAAGTFYDLDISGLDDNHKLIIPDTLEVDDIIAWRIATGDDTYGVRLATAATGSLFEGSDINAGSNKYKYFIQGETGIIRCVKAGGAGDTDSVFQPGGDNRIPCSAHVNLGSNQTITSGNNTQIEFDTTQKDIGDIASVGASDYGIKIRRDGRYRVVLWAYTDLSPSSSYRQITCQVNAANKASAAGNDASQYMRGPVPLTLDLSVDDVVEGWAQWQNTRITASVWTTALYVDELLRGE